ncbi:phage baseplate assembly protein V [Pseudaestuariivita rosea]|uniref:phage baseplate assembly protein V n=1 Tax=Pseudaestuariivita rosea TaxID=2763263 RepID=UPI001ABBB36F|nr:phage baseplate assembly protein V [Pseudaestuariivita rosea]
MTQDRLPALTVFLDGDRLEPRVARQITSIRIRRALSCAAQAEIRITSHDFQVPPLGAGLRIERQDRDEPLFAGAVSAIERARRQDGVVTVTVRGFDALQSLRRSGQAASLQDITPGDIARSMADKLGLGFETQESGPTLPHMIRTDRTDFDFLCSETRRFGLWFHLRAGTLHLHGVDGFGAPRRITLSEDAFEARVEANADQATGSMSFTAFAPDVLDPFPGFAFGLDSSDAYGANTVDADTDIPVLNLPSATEDEALAIASAEMAHRDAGRVTLRAVFDGSYAFHLGQRLEVADIGMDTAGPLPITQIEDRIDVAAGHIVEVSTQPAPLSPIQQRPQMAWAKVVDNDDPTGAGRVRCSFPAIGDTETGWLQVIRPMAGPDRGFAYVPAVDDHVMVLTNSGRLEHAFVLGSLNAQERLAIVDGAGDAKRFGFYSVAGHALTFDDDSKIAELKAPDGSKLALGPDGISLRADGDLTLEAPGGTVTIRGNAIDFERG